MGQAEQEEPQAPGRLSRQWRAEPMLGGWFTEDEIDALVKSVRESLDPAVGFGFFCDEVLNFEEEFARYIGTRYSFSVTSGGTALDLAIKALDLQPGDEVIVPAVNFRAALYAVLGAGGKLILCDSDETLNASPADVGSKLTSRTRAILITHMNGFPAPVDEYLEIAARHPHPKYGPPRVIGDAARALGAGYKGAKIGQQGWMTVFSFHTMKIMTTLGEGGMITTDDPELMRRLHSLRQWGISVSEDYEIARGKKGTGELGWGSNYKMTKVQAAVGRVQLRRVEEMIAPRVALARKRTAMLHGIPELMPPGEPAGCEPVYYLYNLLVQKEWAGTRRDQLMALLRKDYGVETVVANPPVYQVDAYVRRLTAGQSCPKAEELGARLFCPPLHPLMSDADNEYICAAIKEAVAKVRSQSPA